jgi:predicted porin
MKKLLIAAAAMSVVAGAQAQSSVEIYGVLDIGYNNVQSSGTTDVKQTTVGAGGNSGNGSGNLNGSRIGFKGTEDLGGGTKAGFVVEYGINLTGAGTANTADNANGNATIAENAVGQGLSALRQGYVSLSNVNYGTLNAGTQYALHDGASGAVAPSNAIGGTNNVVGASNLLKYGYTAGQPRLTNSIGYVSPNMSGVTLRAIINQGESVTGDSTVAGTTKQNKATSVAIDYVAGKAKVGAAQTKYKDVGAIAATSGMTMLADVLGSGNDRVGATAVAASTRGDYTNTVFGGQYNFGFANVGLNHGTYKADFLATGANDIKSVQDMLSVSVPLSAKFTLNLGYTDGKIDQGAVKAFETSAYDVIGVYTLSKRTNIYGLAVQTKYDSARSGSGYASAKQSQVGVGVRHSF